MPHKALSMVYRVIYPALLAAVLLSNGYSHNASAQTAVQAAHSGTYLTPGRDGEGWLVEVLDQNTALIIWFTFTPAGSDNGPQAWFGGVGTITGNRIVVESANITSGAMFGPDFDPDDVVRTPWGSITFEFDDDRSGSMSYSGLPAYGSGSRPIARVSGIVGLPFGVPAGQWPPPAPGQPGISGTWVDFDNNGEGWFLQEVAPGVVVMAWFTFDDMGRQVWIIGTGVLRDNVVILDSVRIADGTSFGDGFNENDVNRMRWGDIRIVFTDCNTAIVTYQSDFPEFGAGQLEPVRLSSLQSLECAFPPLGNVLAANWRATSNTGPTLSELPAARLGDSIYVAGGYRSGFFSLSELWRYQPASDTWTRLQDMPGPRDHSTLVAFDGDLYLLGGYISSGFLGSPENNTWRYDPDTDQWSILANMPFGRAAAGAAAVIGAHIYSGGGVGSSQIDRYSPAEDSWESFPGLNIFPRDHSAAVAFQGEFWIMGGRDTAGSATTGVTIFDPVTGNSRNGPPMNTPRSGFAASVVNGRIVVTGGENAAPPRVINNTEAYDPAIGGWQSIADLPIAVHGVSGVAFDDDFYVMLGSVLLGGIQNISQVQILDISSP